MLKSLPSLLPAGLAVDQLLPCPDRIVIVAHDRARAALCPVCQHPSARRHSMYVRRLADLPWQDRVVELRLQIRRFRCENPTCRRRIFAERLPEVATPLVRGTGRLRSAQRRIGLALGGEPGSRLAHALAMPISGDTVLRLIQRDQATPPMATPRVLGLDDWAWRRGHRYGTILCDLERGNKVIDLLPDRQAETVAAWLTAHPGVEIGARDRASAYADGIRTGAPAAVQVADRWHLLRNLGDALRGVFDHHHRAVRQAARDVAPTASPAPMLISVPATPPRLTRAEQSSRDKLARREARYEDVAQLRAAGLPIRQIALALGHERKTIRRWLHAGHAPIWRKPPRASLLDPYRSYLERRWHEGVHNAAQLWRELQEQGFPGRPGVVRRWAGQRRPVASSAGTPLAAAPPATLTKVPSSRRAARLMMTATTDAAALSDEEHRFVSALAQRSPEIAQAVDLARRFADMVRRHDGDGGLDAWLAEAEGSALHVFADGLRQDVVAVRSALSLPWSTGPVEGQINRLKTLKRQMYGRAGFDLLRRRVLAAA